MDNYPVEAVYHDLLHLFNTSEAPIPSDLTITETLASMLPQHDIDFKIAFVTELIDRNDSFIQDLAVKAISDVEFSKRSTTDQRALTHSLRSKLRSAELADTDN